MDQVNKKYDVIIIGAGIGGLVCGCYLAKSGMKILIIEKNSNVGGYCCSFRRGKFLFDAAVHSFGNFSEKAAINKIFEELGLRSKIKIYRSNPSDIVKIKDMTIKIDNDLRKTSDNIAHYFPEEKQSISKFFDYIESVKALDCFAQLKGKTFLDLLEAYFKDKRLINILSFPLGNIGLPAHRTAAFSAIMLYRDFIFDGGYYPEGGMQNLADTFANIFKEYGGELLSKTTVTGILMTDKKALGVKIGKERIYSDSVVSNCDGYQTFVELMDSEILSKKFRDRIKNGLPTIPSFVLYMGLNTNIEKYAEKSCTLWHFDDFNVNDIYSAAIDNHISIPPKYFLATFPTMHEPRLAPAGKSIMSIVVGAPFRDKAYWQSNRENMANAIIEKIDAMISGFSDMIEVKFNATPYTMYRYTLNNRGAMCGWASTLDQIYENRLWPSTEIENLYLTGHWTTPPAGQGGVDVVIHSGKTTARIVRADLKRKRKKLYV